MIDLEKNPFLNCRKEMALRRAFQTYLVAAEAGHVPSMIKVGEMCEWGRGVMRDYNEACKWYLKAAEYGDARAQYLLGSFHEYYSDNELEYIGWLKKSAEQGYTDAKYELAAWHERKEDPESLETAKSLYRQAFFDYMKAAKNDDISTMESLGKLFHECPFYKDNDKSVAWYRKAAQKGSPLAKYMLGLAYFYRKLDNLDRNEALAYFREAAGDPNYERAYGAQFDLARVYRKGMRIRRDSAEAFKWMSKCVSSGKPLARTMLADMYFDGEGCERNYEMAYKLYKFSDNAHSHFRLGYMHYMGLGTDRDPVKALCHYKLAARERWSGEAQSMVGFFYEHGLGTEIDLEQAFLWYEKAAGNNHFPAFYEMGRFYESGKGVAPDMEKAFIYYRIAANRGMKEAQMKLSEMYRNGLGIRRSYRLAFSWMKKAADQGDANAQYSIACKYLRGDGVKPNRRSAIKYCKLAAEQNNVDALRMLTELAETNSNIKPDDLFKWLRKWSELDPRPETLGKLGDMLREGKGCGKDFRSAYQCYRRAADAGALDARFKIGEMYEKREI